MHLVFFWYLLHRSWTTCQSHDVAHVSMVWVLAHWSCGVRGTTRVSGWSLLSSHPVSIGEKRGNHRLDGFNRRLIQNSLSTSSLHSSSTRSPPMSSSKPSAPANPLVRNSKSAGSPSAFLESAQETYKPRSSPLDSRGATHPRTGPRPSPRLPGAAAPRPFSWRRPFERALRPKTLLFILPVAYLLNVWDPLDINDKVREKIEEVVPTLATEDVVPKAYRDGPSRSLPTAGGSSTHTAPAPAAAAAVGTGESTDRSVRPTSAQQHGPTGETPTPVKSSWPFGWLSKPVNPPTSRGGPSPPPTTNPPVDPAKGGKSALDGLA